jgi:hypothetical protein
LITIADGSLQLVTKTSTLGGVPSRDTGAAA